MLIKRPHLLKECHSKLLVGDAVFGCADVLLGLIRDVKVDPHEDIFLWERLMLLYYPHSACSEIRIILQRAAVCVCPACLMLIDFHCPASVCFESVDNSELRSFGRRDACA